MLGVQQQPVSVNGFNRRRWCTVGCCALPTHSSKSLFRGPSASVANNYIKTKRIRRNGDGTVITLLGQRLQRVSHSFTPSDERGNFKTLMFYPRKKNLIHFRIQHRVYFPPVRVLASIKFLRSHGALAEYSETDSAGSPIIFTINNKIYTFTHGFRDLSWSLVIIDNQQRRK